MTERDKKFSAGWGAVFDEQKWWEDRLRDAFEANAPVRSVSNHRSRTADNLQALQDYSGMASEPALEWCTSLARKLVEAAERGAVCELVMPDGKRKALRVPRKPLAPWAETLGLKRDSGLTREEIQAAFHARCLVDHPDHGGTDAAFIALTQARDVALARCG